jgi:hypothetical protein
MELGRPARSLDGRILEYLCATGTPSAFLFQNERLPHSVVVRIKRAAKGRPLVCL